MRWRTRNRTERGTVAAEAAVVLPIIAVFTVGLVWMVCLGAAHVRAVDSARETARVVARGESVATGTALGRRVAPTGARVAVSRSRNTVVVSVTAPVPGPGGLFRVLPGAEVTARAVAAREPGS